MPIPGPGVFPSPPQSYLKLSWATQPTCVKSSLLTPAKPFLCRGPAGPGHLCLSLLPVRTPSPHSPRTPTLSGRKTGPWITPRNSRTCFLQVSTSAVLSTLPACHLGLMFLWGGVEYGLWFLLLHKQGWLDFRAHFRLTVKQLGRPCPWQPFTYKASR